MHKTSLDITGSATSVVVFLDRGESKPTCIEMSTYEATLLASQLQFAVTQIERCLMENRVPTSSVSVQCYTNDGAPQ